MTNPTMWERPFPQVFLCIGTSSAVLCTISYGYDNKFGFAKLKLSRNSEDIQL